MDKSISIEWLQGAAKLAQDLTVTDDTLLVSIELGTLGVVVRGRDIRGEDVHQYQRVLSYEEIAAARINILSPIVLHVAMMLREKRSDDQTKG